MKNALFSWKRNEESEPLVTVKTEIQRNKHENPIVYSRKVKKHYGVVYDKRRVLDDFTTLPFGHKGDSYNVFYLNIPSYNKM